MVRRIRKEKHIYDDGVEAKELKAFQKKYGEKRGTQIYFATVQNAIDLAARLKEMKKEKINGRNKRGE